jgi:type VI protein secretion system component VasK
LAEELSDLPRSADLPRILREARALLDRFADDLRAARLPPASVAPARLALALVLDQAARDNGKLVLRDWSAGAHRLLFEGEDMSVARLREFARRAEVAGPDFAAVAAFLESCLVRLEDRRARSIDDEGDGWSGLLAGAVLGFAALVIAWMVYAEWSFHRDTAEAFAAEAVAIGLDRPGAIPDLAARLDRMAAAVDNVEQSLTRAPVRLLAGPLGFDAGDAAQAAQAEAVARHLPPVMARAIDTALASEGDSIALYDTLRAWDILSGAAEWSSGFLQGWLAARPELLQDLQGLVPHVALLTGPSRDLPPPDPELLAQARVFAAQAPEVDRSWIELIRSRGMTGLAPWRPDREIEDLSEVVQRRSGLPLETPIPGAFTTAGWAVAQGGAARAAVETARNEAARMFRTGLPRDPDAADLVLGRLQIETLAVWRAVLADLRVRSFDRPEAGVRISGLLARRESPLALLLRSTWEQVGGLDRSRPHALQLRIATEFGPMIQYVESGGLLDISDLFASLNATLGARNASEEIRNERLLSFGDRAASVAALRQAPPLVVQIVEDVLAQVAVPREAQLANPFTQAWQTDVLDLCLRATQGRFPFDHEGTDADPRELASLLGPDGAIDRYVRNQAEVYIDRSESPWRWRPEARFAGLSPESAAFFERAATLRAAFFGATGALATDVTLAALAERGQAMVALGGANAAVMASSEPAMLAWPGPDPAQGVAVSFDSGGTIAEPGTWGLLRLLAGLRLREREGGQRYLVDLRSDSGRLFLEMAFPTALNPVSGLELAKGFTCPATL